MQIIHQNFRSIETLIDVNWDRLLFPGAILAALMAAAYLGSLGHF